MIRNLSLDGLRGVAVAIVVVHHLFGFERGWFGVDIFFVLSGYLITTILLTERAEPHFWKIFYTRRIARIVPAFLAALLLATVLLPVNWKLFGPYFLFFGENVATIRYRSQIAAAGLAPLWSLAVEEHFYFIWPIQVRRFSDRTLTILLLSVLVASPLARAIAVLLGTTWVPIYFATPFRLDGLVLGALLALGIRHQSWRQRIVQYAPAVLAASMVLFVAAFHWMILERDGTFLAIAGYSLIAVTSAAAVACLITRPTSLLARLISWKPLVFLGKISYSLYLYHFIFRMAFRSYAAQHGYVHVNRFGGYSLPLSLLVAWLSYRFYERRFTDWARRSSGGLLEERSIVNAALHANPIAPEEHPASS